MAIIYNFSLVEDSYGAQFAWGTYVDNQVMYNQVSNTMLYFI